MNYLFQKAGEKRISTVNNSNLPTSMKKLKIHLLAAGKSAKLEIGPTAPIPGPTFPMHVATAPADVKKSEPSRASRIDPSTKSKM